MTSLMSSWSTHARRHAVLGNRSQNDSMSAPSGAYPSQLIAVPAPRLAVPRTPNQRLERSRSMRRIDGEWADREAELPERKAVVRGGPWEIGLRQTECGRRERARQRAAPRADHRRGATPRTAPAARRAVRIDEESSEPERIRRRECSRSIIAAKSAARPARRGPGGGPAPAVASSWMHVTRPSSGSCCPIDGRAAARVDAHLPVHALASPSAAAYVKARAPSRPALVPTVERRLSASRAST